MTTNTDTRVGRVRKAGTERVPKVQCLIRKVRKRIGGRGECSRKEIVRSKGCRQNIVNGENTKKYRGGEDNPGEKKGQIW